MYVCFSFLIFRTLKYTSLFTQQSAECNELTPLLFSKRLLFIIAECVSVFLGPQAVSGIGVWDSHHYALYLQAHFQIKVITFKCYSLMKDSTASTKLIYATAVTSFHGVLLLQKEPPKNTLRHYLGEHSLPLVDEREVAFCDSPTRQVPQAINTAWQ